jgi:hypothetical protein
MTLGYREKCLAQKINACNVCGSGDDLVVHHLDGDPENNSLDNLIPMCDSCHSKLHTSKSLSGHMKRLQDRLPESALSHGEGRGLRAKSGGSNSRVPVRNETHELLRERKPDGETFDRYIRRLMGVEGPPVEVDA